MSSSEDMNYSFFYSEVFQVENKNLEPKKETSILSMKEFHVLQYKVKHLSIFVQNSSLSFFQITTKVLVDIRDVLQELVSIARESPEIISINTI
jgi:hypothetical protein